MTLNELTGYRLVNQQLAQTNFSKPAEIVWWLGAMQAQEYAHSKWSIGLRLPGCSDLEIETAFTSGEILRTHLLRPTWHFVTPMDISWLLKLTAPRVNIFNRFMYRKMELDDKIFIKSNEVLTKALQGGKQLTRTILQSELNQKKITASGIRLALILMQAELAGVICSGSRSGKQFTYALLEERVTQVKAVPQEEALAELTSRYFNSRGPATVKDFATWSGLTTNQVKQGLTLVQGALLSETYAGEVHYFPQTALPRKKSLSPAFLLPPYDEYIMGYRNKAPIFTNRNKINPPPALNFDNTIIIDGQVAGSWKRSVKNSSILLEYQVFQQMHEPAISEAIMRFSKFMQVPVMRAV